MDIKPLSKKEALFCQAYAALGTTEEAAHIAEYSIQAGYKKMLDPRIREESQRLMRETSFGTAKALAGLNRLAFGSSEEFLNFILNRDRDVGKLDGLDLFCVYKVKVCEKGDVEITFHDRQKALESLILHAGENEKNASEHSFYTALEKSAKALSSESDE